MTMQTSRRPGLKLMLIGAPIVAVALAAVILIPGVGTNNGLLAVLMLLMVAGAVVFLVGAVKRIIDNFRSM
jgi:hypothetical protein